MGECEKGLGFEEAENQQQKQVGLEEKAESLSSSSPDLDPPVSVETLAEKLEEVGFEGKDDSGGTEIQDQNWNGKDDVDDEDEKSKNRNQEGEAVETRRVHYPLRAGEPDCPFYLRTGTCRYGSNCKFNHPPRRKSQARSASESSESVQAVKEKENDEYPERIGQPECKYYLKTGGCKYGKACRYSHPHEKSVVAQAKEFNFLGLPIRPGEKECPFYMRVGSCKFGTNCRFHHPDPTAAGISDPMSGYGNGGSIPLHSAGVAQPTLQTWPLPRPSNDAIPYLEAPPTYVPVILPPPQGAHLNVEWNGYQAPVSPLYPHEGKVLPPVLKDSAKNADGSAHHYQQSPVDEFPERPGHKECQYYMKNGDCKYRSACRFHHPKNHRAQKSPALSPIGLPLRPDQMVCSHYSRYGICKYGPACKYDHPPNSGSVDQPVMPSSGHPKSFDSSASIGGPQMADPNKPAIPQTMIHPPNSGSSDCPVVSC